MTDQEFSQIAAVILAGMMASPRANIQSKHVFVTYPHQAVKVAAALVEALEQHRNEEN